MTSVEQDHRIVVESDQVTVRNFTTHDSDIVTYFENLDESDNLEQKLESALKIGIAAIKSIGVTGNVNYVEKAFDSLNEKMKQELELVFSKDGKFSGILENQFGEDGKLIKDLFDPHREGSPLYSLRSELEKHLLEIMKEIGINKKVKEADEKGTRKGIDFEKQCEEKLSWITNVHADVLERTGNIEGKLKNKKGDFLIELGDVKKKIVFEMKDRGYISQPDIHKELDSAMENRGAEYGILVARNKKSLHESIGWFNEYNGRHLVCAVEDGDGNSFIDGEIIHIAYKWARARLRMESVKEKKLDPSFIIEKTKTIQGKIEDMKTVKARCTSIEKSTEDIRKTVRDTESAIKNDLNEIVDSLYSENTI